MQVKEARLKSLHSVWVYLYDFSENIVTEDRSKLTEPGEGDWVTYKCA